MLKEIKYDRKKALEYAKEWAFKRNPKYLNFENIGGDCTSYESQCRKLKEMWRLPQYNNTIE